MNIRLRDMLFPRAEADEGFRQEILSLSHRGLQIVAAVEIVLALIGLMNMLAWRATLWLLLTGAVTAVLSRVNPAYVWHRAFAIGSTIVAVLVVARTITVAADEDYALGSVAILVLACTAGSPLKPMQSLAVGLAAVLGGYDCTHRLFLVMLALVALAISTTLYTQRRANYVAYLSVLQASQDFRSIQSRLLVAENPAALVRLSAALAHELSQPVGAVTSGLDTLLAVCARHAKATPEEMTRLAALELDLGRSLKTSLDRLKRMVNRIQRLTDLDEAGQRAANVNELINEAVALVKPQAPETAIIEFRLQPVPTIECRPQQLLTVLTTVLTNSIQAIQPDGIITIGSRAAGGRIEVSITDTGCGIATERLATIFDPGFQVDDGRVATGNWSLFTARQFMKEHSGEMRIQSQPGQGTTVSLTLPCGP